VRLAWWPGLGSGPRTLAEVAPALADAGVEVEVLDPRYGSRDDWSLPALARELTATGADAYGGASYGAAVAVTAAVERPPDALVLVDGGYATLDELGRPSPAQLEEQERELQWASEADFLAWARARSSRWNDVLAQIDRANVDWRDGRLVPLFDAQCLDAIMDGYREYDPVACTAALPATTRTLLLVPTPRPPASERFASIAEVREVGADHNIVRSIGPAFGELVGEWLVAA
jgi:hypothetical protein